MRDIYQIVIAIYLFFLCINMGFWFLGNALNIPLITGYSTDFNTLQDTYNSTAGDFQGGNAFNAAFIFGDFGKAINTFFGIISGAYVLNTMTIMGFSEYFVLPMQVIIVGFMSVISLIYLVSGRQ